jgi:hypothetical protein
MSASVIHHRFVTGNAGHKSAAVARVGVSVVNQFRFRLGIPRK